VIRGRIWNVQGIPVWYRQNLLLYVKEDRIDDLNLSQVNGSLALRWIHPEVFTHRARAARYVLGLRHVMPARMVRWFQKRLGL
jgi:hypothetical protein